MKTKFREIHVQGRSHAFTLIELMVVMAILVLLVALLVVPATNVMHGFALSSAGQMMQSKLALSRQLAISRNRIVEVRFYEVPDLMGARSHFRMMQSYMFDANGANPTPVEQATTLPQGIIFEALPTSGGTATSYSSTVIDLTPDKGTQVLAGAGNGSFPYRAFRFRSNGSTDLALNGTGSDTWFLTVKRETDTNTPPRNYFTVQIDPFTGQTRAFRP